MKDDFLHNTAGISQVGQHFEASVIRAVADLLYYCPWYHFDNQLAIDFQQVKQIQKEIGYVK